MQIIKDTTQFDVEKKSVVAIGKFDGIHKGHQSLIEHMKQAKEKGLKTIIFTFDPSPAAFFSGTKMKELSTKEEKRAYFKRLGMDVLIEFPMNEQTAKMPPEEFIQNILAKSLHAKKIVAGSDVSFGDKGAGNYEFLKKHEMQYGYEVLLLEKVCMEGKEISSTYVREEIEKGNVSLAAKLLGAPYLLAGKVVKGKQIGRTIDTPTVNILPPEEKLLPPNGVYVSFVKWKDGKSRGLTNIGCKPTVTNETIIGAETFLYDVKEDMYGKTIEVELLEYLRPEQKFATLEALKQQMEKDKENGLAFFSKG